MVELTKEEKVKKAKQLLERTEYIVISLFDLEEAMEGGLQNVAEYLYREIM